jgi:NADH-quinone oxidoreductase subunit F
VRSRRLPRRGVVRLRRGLRAHHVDRRQARLSAQPAAATHRARALSEATVINNVETLSNVAWIVANGGEAFKKIGHEKDPGTRLISISGHIARPGVYEIECGYPFHKFIYDDCGGGASAAGRSRRSSRRHLDQGAHGSENRKAHARQPSLAAAGSSMGSGGMVVIGDGTCMVRLLQVLLRFYHHESCGQCTPCREGMGWLHRIIDRIVAGEGRPEDVDRLYQISAWNDGTTICGMGDAAGYATAGILNKFRDEFEYFIEHKRSRYDGALACPRFS